MKSLRSDLISLLEQFFDKRHISELLKQFYVSGEEDDLELLSLVENSLPSLIGKETTNELIENIKKKYPSYTKIYSTQTKKLK